MVWSPFPRVHARPGGWFVKLSLSEYHMVKNLNPEHLAGLNKALCQKNILLARPRVAGRVIVPENQRRRALEYSKPEKLTGMDKGRCERA
jgi:hypothetical protein